MPTCDFRLCSYEECDCRDCRECKILKNTTIKKKEKRIKKVIPKIPIEDFYTEGYFDEFLYEQYLNINNNII